MPTVAVIPAAGLGTRMRPATRVVPKAFLPLIDRPAIQYAVEEAAAAGATEIYAITDPDVAELVERHFAEELPGLEGVSVVPVVQAQPLGLGDAVAIAASAVDGRQFMCLLVDELVRPGHEILGRLTHEAGDGSAVAVRTVADRKHLSRYGVVEAGDRDGASFDLVSAVEKPTPQEAPSDLALVGRYVFHPEIFEALAGVGPGHSGEVQLTDGINVIAPRCRGVIADGILLDIGNPLGMAQAKYLLAMQNPDWGEEYRRFISENR